MSATVGLKWRHTHTPTPTRPSTGSVTGFPSDLPRRDGSGRARGQQPVVLQPGRGGAAGGLREEAAGERREEGPGPNLTQRHRHHHPLQETGSNGMHPLLVKKKVHRPLLDLFMAWKIKFPHEYQVLKIRKGLEILEKELKADLTKSLKVGGRIISRL